MKEVFLGTGANGGVPQIDCRCENCEAADKNIELTRLRSCVLIDDKEKKIILDCGPDFRKQVLKARIRLKDISLVVITHLHFDHAGGLMELSGGKECNVPVLVSGKNKASLEKREDTSYLINRGFMRLVDEREAESLGIRLVDVPHSSQFPTNAVVVELNGKKLWYSPDVAEITTEMAKQMRDMNLVIFDATFLNEKVYPASKFGHLTIERSAPRLADINNKLIYSHINHSENYRRVENFLSKFGFKLAHDSMNISLDNP